MFGKVLIEQNKTILESQQNFVNETNLEMNANTNEIAKLNAELAAANNLIIRCDSQFALFKDLSDKLEKQFNETLSAKTQNCIETVDFKTREIENLLAALHNKTNELNNKDLKIKALEERMKIWDGHKQ